MQHQCIEAARKRCVVEVLASKEGLSACGGDVCDEWLQALEAQRHTYERLLQPVTELAWRGQASLASTLYGKAWQVVGRGVEAADDILIDERVELGAHLVCNGESGLLVRRRNDDHVAHIRRANVHAHLG